MKQHSGKQIRLIALDLDGTTLTKRGITRRTRRTLEKAIAVGVPVAVATGRVFSALPPAIFRIRGLEYVVTSNGAQIRNLSTGKVIYSDYIEAEALRPVKAFLQENTFPVEIFTDGKAYIDRKIYEDLRVNGSNFMNAPYVLRTRIPVDGIYDFWEKNIGQIENVNIHFPTFAEKDAIREILCKMADITVTSSVPHNLEIGGRRTSKARGLEHLCELLHIDMEQVMACGDSLNDLAMIREAGLGIAMKNGEREVREEADYIAPSNEEEGVAYAVEKFVLGKNPEKKARLYHGIGIISNSFYAAARKLKKIRKGKKFS